MSLIGLTDRAGAPFPDVGQLAYNGVVFNCLFKSKVTGRAVKDMAVRTVKYVEWTIEVDGVVTLDTNQTTIDNQMTSIKFLLNQQAGILTYRGRGLGQVVVNTPGGALRDVAWGPKPEVLDFQPLGASRSALVKWTVTTCLPVLKEPKPLPPPGPAGGVVVDTNLVIGDLVAQDIPAPVLNTPPVIQFNEETTISYDDEGYSTLSIKGTLEVPLTRNSVNDRSVPGTVDNFRHKFMDQVANNIDLRRFRIPKRTFNESRDKRTLEWEFVAEELPPMPLPPGAASARGRYTVRPFKDGPSVLKWVCSLTCTYTIRADQPRWVAWWAFISLMKFRMAQSELGFYPDTLPTDNGDQNPATPPPPQPPGDSPLVEFAKSPIRFFYRRTFGKKAEDGGGAPAAQPQQVRAIPIHFGFDEGLYLDSKTVTFEASWILFTSFSHLLLASGIWTAQSSFSHEAGRKLWAQSVRNIAGWQGVLANRQVASQDVIVDLGGP